jgi:hypothetical protein
LFLEKGCNYNTEKTPMKNITNLISETENAINMAEDSQQEAIRYLAAHNI